MFHATVTVCVDGFDNVTGITNGVVPLLPSNTEPAPGTTFGKATTPADRAAERAVAGCRRALGEHRCARPAGNHAWRYYRTKQQRYNSNTHTRKTLNPTR